MRPEAAMVEAEHRQQWQLDPGSVRALAHGLHPDPFGVLGPHDSPEGRVIRAFLPGASKVVVLRRSDQAPLLTLEHTDASGLFEGIVSDPTAYLLRIHWPHGVQETEDPYSLGLLLGDMDLFLFNEGRHFELGKTFGAQAITIDGVSGVRFAVWAPNAARVAVVGDFNSWDRRRHPMRLRHSAGVWELFIPRVTPGSHYKYDILGPNGVAVPWKADPVARQTELPPGTASIVPQFQQHRWR